MAERIGTPDGEALCRLLRGLRTRAGLRQEDVARALDRPQSFVSAYELGHRRLDILQVRDICRVLGLTLPDFALRLEREIRDGTG